MHDFALYKQNSLPMQPERTCFKADSGYLGVGKLHANSQVPQKSSKHHPLTPEQKASNHQLSSQRMLIEHVIGWIKRFRMIAERYRNRRRRFALRFNRIAAIYNKEMAH